MTRLYRVASIFFLTSSACFAAEPEGWLVGFAQADITPATGQAMMAGFGRERYADGVLTPLRAQALAFRDSTGKTALLLVADVLGFDRVTVDRLRRKIEADHGLPPEAVCFSASHTHWGPAINYRANFAIGGINVWYLGHLEAKLLDLAAEALKDLAPARVGYGACEAQIGMCRRRPNDKGEFGWGPYPPGSYDRHTPVLRIQRGTSPAQIVLVGHACHPTSTGLVGKWSADYPGAMRDRIEATLDDCRAVFVMGCGGDAKVVHRDPATNEVVFSASPEQSEAGGTKLAETVLDYLEGQPLADLQPTIDTKLVRGALSLQEPPSQAEIEQMALDGDPRTTATWWARQSLAYPDRRREQRYDVQAWRLGDLTVLALEGEVCADWGAMARSLASTRHAMTIGYANHVPGYIPTARIIREGGYEGGTSHMAYFLPAPLDPRSEPQLSELLLEAVGRVEPGESQPAPAYENKTELLEYVDADGREQRVTNRDAWEVRRAHILANLQRVLGPLPGPSFRVPLDVQVIEETDQGSYTRKKIAYNVDPSDRVESYLLVPHNLRGKTPAILALHQTGQNGKDEPVGLGGNPELHYAKELAERGYVVIAPDYWPMGHYRNKDYDPHFRGYASGAMKGVWGHVRALDVLETLPEVDPERIGCIGHSLGGYNTVFLGALEPRVKAMVSSAGYNSFVDYAASPYGGGELKNWSLDKHLRRIRTVYNDDPAQVPFDFPELVAALAPRPFFTSAPTEDHVFVLPGVTKCLDAARPVYELLGASENLQAVFPEAKHDFPSPQRQAAYEFLDRHLRSGSY